MATFTSAFKQQPVNAQEGNTVTAHDSVTPTAGAQDDVYRFGPFPPGVEANKLTVINADLDTGVALAIKAGYSFKDGSAAPAGADEAFIATGSAILQTASPVDGNNFVVKPFEIKKEWFLDIVVTTAAGTFASGEITAIVQGIARGPQ